MSLEESLSTGNWHYTQARAALQEAAKHSHNEIGPTYALIGIGHALCGLLAVQSK